MNCALLSIQLLALMWASVSGYTLLMNCTAQNLRGSSCQNYMRNYISDYVTGGNAYNRLTLPVLNPYWHRVSPTNGDSYENVPVKIELNLENLVAVDTASGTMTMAVFLALYWTDRLLNWDPQWTDGYQFLSVDPAQIWRPDVRLYNIVGEMNDQIQKPDMFLKSNGSMWWNSNGLITFTCSYDTSKFPFDQQKCTAVFGSWTYASYQMNVSSAVIQQSPSFTNIAWEVTGVSAQVTEAVQWEVYPYAFAEFSVSVRRYSNHYVSTAIVPSLLVTVLALGALWVRDVATRLGIAITALLTLIAVQWTVSQDLPVSADETWLGQLSDLCVCFTALVSVLGFAVGYLRFRQESEGSGADRGAVLPHWACCIVSTDKVVHECLTRLFVATVGVVCSPLFDPHQAAREAKGSTTNTKPQQAAPAEGSTDSAHSRSAAAGENLDEPSPQPSAAEGPRLRRSTTGSGCNHPLDAELRSATDVGQQSRTGPAWDSVADAVDHLSKVTLPAAFLCALIVYCADAAASSSDTYS